MKTARHALLFFIFMILVTLAGQPAFAAKTLTMGKAKVNTGGDEDARTIELDLKAAHFDNVNGMVFTLTYDAGVFDFIGLVKAHKPIDNNYNKKDTPATIAGTIYYQANKAAPGRVLIAAAGAEYLAPSAGEYTPFKVKFRVKPEQTKGIYPINLEQTVIGPDTAKNAGYDAKVKLPVAAGLAPGADPADAKNFSVSLVSGSIEVSDQDAGDLEPVVIPEKPESRVIVKPGEKSVPFSVKGGDSIYTWSVTGPAPMVDVSGNTFVFKAPVKGNFAGEYTISVKDSMNTNSESFKIYVPMNIDPGETKFVFRTNDPVKSFKVTGAAEGAAFTAAIDSLDDDSPVEKITGKFSQNFEAIFNFDPAKYKDKVTQATGTKQYTIDFTAQGHESLPQIDLSILPLKDFKGMIADSSEGAPINGAIVTITSPAAYAGRAVESGTGVNAGEFIFTGLPATLLNGKTANYQFKVEKKGYISVRFTSGDLTGDTPGEIKMKKAAALISGTITNPEGAICWVTLLDKDKILAGPVDSKMDGSFTFNLETVPALPKNFIIKACRAGWSGETQISVKEFDYTDAALTLAEITGDIPEVSGAKPSGGKGIIDGASGGNTDLTQEGGLHAQVKSAFGSNKIKLVILPKADGKIVNVALPAPADPAQIQNPSAPKTALKWEISGLGSDGCALIPVPFKLSDADKLSSGDYVVLYAHESAPDTWKAAEIEGEIDYLGDGVNGIIHARICGWSSNTVGVGAKPGDDGTGNEGTDEGSDGACFISLVSAGDTGLGAAWLALAAGFVAAGFLAATRKADNQTR